MTTSAITGRQISAGLLKKVARARDRLGNFVFKFKSKFLDALAQQQLSWLVALGSILVLGFVFFLAFQYYQFQSIRRSQYQLQGLLDQVDGTDTTLRMAAQLGAATTDTSWSIIHGDKKKEMDEILQKLIKLHAELASGNSSNSLKESHTTLLKIEDSAFKMIRDGGADYASAGKLLDNPNYQQKRQAFKENLQKIGKELSESLQNKTTSCQNLTLEVSGGLLLLSLFLLFPIIRVLRQTKHIEREREVAEQQLGRLNSCFLSFESNSQTNIQSLVNVCAELMHADGVVYQRIEDEKIVSVASSGRKFCKDEEPFQHSLAECVLDHISIIPLCWSPAENAQVDLTPFLDASCRSYIAQAVRSGDELIGVLHLFYQGDMRPTAQNLRFITIVCSAIVPEERRLRAVETLRASEASLEREREQLSVTLSSITDGVISTDLKNRVTLMNRIAEKLTGWTFEEARGRQLADVFCFSLREVPRDSRVWTTPGRGTIPLSGVTLKSRKGEQIAIEGNYAPIIHDNDSIVGHLVVFSDQRETQRLQAQVALSSKLQSIGQLAAGIAHEINTPMQFISDNTSFLRKSYDDTMAVMKLYQRLASECHEAGQFPNTLDEIQSKETEIDAPYLTIEIPTAFNETLSGIERVTKLVKAMKTFSHPTQGSMQLCDLNQSIEATVNVSRNEWKYVADLELDLDPNLPLVSCLIDELNQVVLNMITNSVDAIKESLGPQSNKKGSISITTRAEGNEVKIVLKDSGMGMPQEVIDKIFDPFFTTKEPGKGTGQGLAISHDIIVNKHKGKIEVQSEPGKGTQFTIVLPLNAP